MIDHAAADRTGAHALHVYADAGGVEPTAQVDQLALVLAAGWRMTVMLPASSAWARFADLAARAGASVVRWPVQDRRPATRRLVVLGASDARSRLLRSTRTAVVHAHDRPAIDQWRVAARRGDVPLLWDMDLRGVGAGDGRRLAAASYVITGPGGRRPAAHRMLPPHRAAAGGCAGDWYDLAAADGDAAQLPVGPRPTVCDVYTCLTGLRPTPSADRVGATDLAAVLAG